MPLKPEEHADPLECHRKYRLINSLGNGACGFVHLYQNKESGELVAIKFIRRKDLVPSHLLCAGVSSKYVEAEIINHRVLRHPHVVQFKEVFLTDKYICIAMEYATGGNLHSFVTKSCFPGHAKGRLPEVAARWFFQQLMLGLDYCHKKGVVNRDIKLENTVLQPLNGLLFPLLKICDFGYSKANWMSAPKSKVGTLAYMSPEVLFSEGTYDGQQTDIWSCGVMLFAMLFGEYPFESHQKNKPKEQRTTEVIVRITQVIWSIPADIPISPECQDLLTHMLVADPAQRLTMKQIFNHPWFKTNLPPGASEMNSEYLLAREPRNLQSVVEIQTLLRTSLVPLPEHRSSAPGPSDFTDVQIDSPHIRSISASGV